MAELPPHAIPLIHETEASEEVNEMFGQFKQMWQLPFVPNMVKGIAPSTAALKMYLGLNREFEENLTLPGALASMICFTVAEKSDCTYCAATHELTCRHLGVDEETLRTIAKDLKDVNPERIRSIIEFALKAAKYPQQLEPADYDAVRAHGVTNDEIIEIIMVAGFAVFLDIVADGLKVEVEKEVVDALAQ
jgi:uncharacterized peroxidase-related enzyme